MQIRFGAMSPKLHEQLGVSEEETALEQRCIVSGRRTRRASGL